MGPLDLILEVVKSPLGQWAITAVTGAITAWLGKKGLDKARRKLVMELFRKAFPSVEGLARRSGIKGTAKFNAAVDFVNRWLKAMGEKPLTKAEMGMGHAEVDMMAAAAPPIN